MFEQQERFKVYKVKGNLRPDVIQMFDTEQFC